MTPKEKAKELVQRYIDEAYQEDEYGLYTPMAKQCALIAVDEILDTIEDERKGIFNMKRYWEQVKQEIEKL